MRTLSATLIDAQKKGGKPYIKISLSFTGKTTYTFEHPGRILTIEHDEEPYNETARIVLHNADKDLTDIDLHGYKVVIGYGFKTSAGNEYANSNELYVMEQNYNSVPGHLTCELVCIGQRNQMAEDRAKSLYTPTTETTKALITAILGSTLAPYNDLPAYILSYDSEDTLLNTFTPKESFRILVNTNRQAALSRLLMYTKCVSRPQNDGKIHIFLPITTGTTYDYEYALTGDYHRFLNKSKRKRIVIPNHIKVSDYEEPPTYSGEASDTESINNYRRDIFQYEKFYSLASNAQAAELAGSILARYQMNAQTASAIVPMNVGAEIYDYVKITDVRENDTAIGNIGYIHRRFSALSSREYPMGRYDMTIGFGGWLNMRRTLNEMDADPTSVSDRTLDSLQAKYILADQIDFTDITIDTIQDGVTYKRTKSAAISAEGLVLLDTTVDGSTYKKVLATQVQAGKILLSSETSYATGYDPSTKRRTFTSTPVPPYDVGDIWMDANTVKRCTTARASGYYVASDWEATTLDAIADGTTYGKLLKTDISAGHILLSSYTGASGEWYNVSGVIIDATKGIRLYGKDMAFGTFADVTNARNGTNWQCKMDSNGKLLAGAGAVVLDSGGIKITGQFLRLQQSGYTDGVIFLDSGHIYVQAGSGKQMRLSLPLSLNSFGPYSATTAVNVTVLANYDHKYIPSQANYGYIGSSDYYWYYIYARKLWYKDASASFGCPESLKKLDDVRSLTEENISPRSAPHKIRYLSPKVYCSKAYEAKEKMRDVLGLNLAPIERELYSGLRRKHKGNKKGLVDEIKALGESEMKDVIRLANDDVELKDELDLNPFITEYGEEVVAEAVEILEMEFGPRIIKS